MLFSFDIQKFKFFANVLTMVLFHISSNRIRKETGRKGIDIETNNTLYITDSVYYSWISEIISCFQQGYSPHLWQQHAMNVQVLMIALVMTGMKGPTLEYESWEGLLFCRHSRVLWWCSKTKSKSTVVGTTVATGMI